MLDEGQTVAAARDLGLTESSLRNWVEHARADRTRGKTGLTTVGREELVRLRKELRIAQEQRDILKKWSCAAAHPRRHERDSVWLSLAAEIETHDQALNAITLAAAPTLREAFGIGSDSAAEMMIVAGDNPTRGRSEAAFAKLCGACPIPASSSVTHRHRLFRGGHRQADAALYRIVTVRMRWHQPTMDYLKRPTAQGQARHYAVLQAVRWARDYHALLTEHRARHAVAASA